MSIGHICETCGDEHDMRHGRCPACTVEIQMRAKEPPHHTWTDVGYIPFEMHGERFAVTRIPGGLTTKQPWRATHIATGVAIPNTMAETKEEARDRAIAVLGHIGSEKLQAAIAEARRIIAGQSKRSA